MEMVIGLSEKSSIFSFSAIFSAKEVIGVVAKKPAPVAVPICFKKSLLLLLIFIVLMLEPPFNHFLKNDICRCYLLVLFTSVFAIVASFFICASVIALKGPSLCCFSEKLSAYGPKGWSKG